MNGRPTKKHEVELELVIKNQLWIYSGELVVTYNYSDGEEIEREIINPFITVIDNETNETEISKVPEADEIMLLDVMFIHEIESYDVSVLDWS